MPETETSYSAFISHASTDREKADRICESLESRGFRCWIAPRDVSPGQEYGEAIIRGIEASRCLVLVLSEEANQSTFVRREVERAVSKKKPVFSIRVEDVLPSPSLELFVSTTHWIDAWAGQLTEHVDRLAQNLADDSVVAQAQHQSARIQRRRQMPKWLVGAASLIGLVLAIVIGNHLSWQLGGGGSSREMTVKSMEMPEPPSYKQQMDQVIGAFGGDPDKLTKEDFKVRLILDRGHNFELKVDMSAEASAGVKFANRTMLRIGEQAAKIFDHKEDRFYDHELDQAALASAETITLRYDLPNGESVGPFTYPINQRQARLAAYKDQLVKAWKNAQNGRTDVFKAHGGPSAYLYSSHNLGEFLPALTAIRVGESPDSLNTVFSITPALTTANGRGEVKPVPKKDFGHLPIRPGAKTVFVQLHFYDGTKTSPLKVPVSYSKHNIVDGKALRAEGQGQAPPLYAAARVDRRPPELLFRPAVPLGTAAVMYSFDEGGFYDANSESREWHLDTRFTFKGKLQHRFVRLKFRGKDGQEHGPFRYRFDPSRLLLRTLKADFQFHEDKAAAAFHFPNTPPTHLIASKVGVHPDKLNIEGATLVCVPNMDTHSGPQRILWAAVKRVWVGVRHGQLDRDAAVSITPKQVIEDDLSEPAFAIHLPVDTKQVYVQYVYYDDTESREYRVPIQKFE